MQPLKTASLLAAKFIEKHNKYKGFEVKNLISKNFKKSFAGIKKVVCLQPLKTGTFLGKFQRVY